MSNKELVELSTEGFYLSEEDKHALIQELKSREMLTEAQNVDLMFEEKINLKDLSSLELKDLIISRLKMGESAESIKKDFEEEGIAMPDLYDLDETVARQDIILETIALHNKKGHSSEKIYEHINETFGLEEVEVEHLKKELKYQSIFYIVLGSLMITISIFMAILALFNDGIILLFGIFGTGIALLVKGIRLR